MKYDTHQIIDRLIGAIEPVGESHIDSGRYQNLQEYTELVSYMLDKIHLIATTNNDCHEHSVIEAREHCREFLDKLYQLEKSQNAIMTNINANRIIYVVEYQDNYDIPHSINIDIDVKKVAIASIKKLLQRRLCLAVYETSRNDEEITRIKIWEYKSGWLIDVEDNEVIDDE